MLPGKAASSWALIGLLPPLRDAGYLRVDPHDVGYCDDECWTGKDVTRR